MTISAKVAGLITDRQVALNAGSEKGVRVGDAAKIVKRTTIKDPDTDAALGSVTVTLLSMRIASVAEKFSLAQTFEIRTKDESGSPTALYIGALGRPTGVQRVTLDPNEADWQTYHIAIGTEVEISTPEVKATEQKPSKSPSAPPRTPE